MTLTRWQPCIATSSISGLPGQAVAYMACFREVTGEEKTTITKNKPNVVERQEQKKRRRLKIAGSAVVLLSFVTQNFLYDRWNARTELLERGIVYGAIIDKSVLLNEVLYFTASPSPGATVEDLKKSYIREAARKLSMSGVFPIASDENLKAQEKVDLSNALLSQARGVNDLSSFLALVRTVNDSYGKYPEEMHLQAAQLDSKRAMARYIYLALYVLGTLLLLIAMRNE